MNPVEYIYYMGYRLSRWNGLRKQRRLPHKTISIGNLTLGGTGKTPLVISIAEKAKKLGYSPCILTRGYRGRAKNPVFVSKGDGPLIDYSDSGDEPYLMALRLRGVEIIKSADRYEAGVMSEKADLFIIDDGFQHRRLHRDVDIVLIDAGCGFGNGRLFPVGPLREPITELSRASIIILTKNTTTCVAAKSDIYRLAGTSIPNITDHIYKASHGVTSLITPQGERLPASMLTGKNVYAFCGIGNPQSFADSLKAAGANVLKLRIFRDHHNYKPSEIKSLLTETKSSSAKLIITTEKDLIKLKDFPAQNLFALVIDFIIDDSFYDIVI
ncbi:MAG: tetraacyldisaccharide 4'-kinase [Nitrospirae bacterium YQR-1]